jgi:hypothetical protein
MIGPQNTDLLRSTGMSLASVTRTRSPSRSFNPHPPLMWVRSSNSGRCLPLTNHLMSIGGTAPLMPIMQDQNPAPASQCGPLTVGWAWAGVATANVATVIAAASAIRVNTRPVFLIVSISSQEYRFDAEPARSRWAADGKTMGEGRLDSGGYVERDPRSPQPSGGPVPPPRLDVVPAALEQVAGDVDLLHEDCGWAADDLDTATGELSRPLAGWRLVRASQDLAVAWRDDSRRAAGWLDGYSAALQRCAADYRLTDQVSAETLAMFPRVE